MQGFCAPNPAVGAIVVRGEHVIAAGYHRGPGMAHAEVDALADLGDLAEGCDLYVTLEPCCHQGRTPPCTDLIIKHKLARVFFGYYDPNPQVAGKGQRLLQDAGIECEYMSVAAIDDFYAPYKFWWQYQRPQLTAKLAITDRHQIAIDPITGSESQHYTHQQRLSHDALLTTVETVIADDPQFNARLIDPSIKKPLYILDSQARLPVTARVLTTCDPVTVFYADGADQLRIQALEQAGVSCVKLPLERPHRLDLLACLRFIGTRGVQQLWLEAGWTCFSSFLRQGLIDRALFYIAREVPANKRVRSFDFSYELGQPREITWGQTHPILRISVSY